VAFKPKFEWFVLRVCSAADSLYANSSKSQDWARKMEPEGGERKTDFAEYFAFHTFFSNLVQIKMEGIQ
jgi:hypothetical protein